VYILVGPDTASAAEIFSFTLKQFKKAIIIGQKTRGIANPVQAIKINKFFVGRFSMSRITNPITNTNWEIVGVILDIKSSLDKSFEVAHTKALEVLNERNQKR